MKELVVVSGKGGTGKTSLVASFAVLAGRSVLADCDVDAADLHLVLNPRIKREELFSGGKTARVLQDLCSGCGKCAELCRFGAVTRVNSNGKTVFEIDPIVCEGCGVCSYFCPEKAVEFKPSVNGRWYISETAYGPMVHARLGVAEENSGKLVTLVRSQARELAEREGLSRVIVDGPPGIGCPVIASLTGADYVVIVTEPTVAGRHDLERVVKLTQFFELKTFVCINKYDLNERLSGEIEKEARACGVTVLGGVRYDDAVNEAQLKGIPVVLLKGAPAAQDIARVWDNLLMLVGGRL